MKTTRETMFLVLVLISANIFAQRTTDIENSKDYPLVSRFSGAVIEFYEETIWGSYKLPVDENGQVNFDLPQTLEGKVTRIQYTAPPQNSAEFILHNYRTAFAGSGYNIMIAVSGSEMGFSDRPHTWIDKYYDTGGFYNGINNFKFGRGIGFPFWKTDQSFIVARGHHQGQDIYIVVYTVVADNYALITQDVIEVEAPETGLVSAESIDKGIAANGYIDVYDILFETGKWEIMPESANAMKIIADYLKSHSGKKFYVVGHTDNVGNFTSNMTLSENRAKAVAAELINKYGVAPEQISAYGVSSLSPVTSNSTDAGKARNRRVVIAEQ